MFPLKCAAKSTVRVSEINTCILVFSYWYIIFQRLLFSYDVIYSVKMYYGHLLFGNTNA